MSNGARIIEGLKQAVEGGMASVTIGDQTWIPMRRVRPGGNRPQQEMQAEIDALRGSMLEYLSEIDNPVPDAMHRRTLRNRMRALSGAPPEPSRNGVHSR